jgi:hypothetical protein
MIVEKKPKTSKIISSDSEQTEVKKETLILEEQYEVNALTEAYLAVREILSKIKLNDSPDSPPLFRTIKLDTGQLNRIKNNKHNHQDAIAFPAVFIHFVNVYYNVGQSRISEGKATMRIHYILNTLNLEDDIVEQQGLKIFNTINKAIQSNYRSFPALVNRFQLSYWEQPLTFDDGVQPYWIDYDIWFNEYSAYRYKEYVETYLVVPPFTNHSDQKPESNPNNHEDHRDIAYDDVSEFKRIVNESFYHKESTLHIEGSTTVEDNTVNMNSGTVKGVTLTL